MTTCRKRSDPSCCSWWSNAGCRFVVCSGTRKRWTSNTDCRLQVQSASASELAISSCRAADRACHLVSITYDQQIAWIATFPPALSHTKHKQQLHKFAASLWSPAKPVTPLCKGLVSPACSRHSLCRASIPSGGAHSTTDRTSGPSQPPQCSVGRSGRGSLRTQRSGWSLSQKQPDSQGICSFEACSSSCKR